jgi:hypothetical protein
MESATSAWQSDTLCTWALRRHQAVPGGAPGQPPPATLGSKPSGIKRRRFSLAVDRVTEWKPTTARRRLRSSAKTKLTLQVVHHIFGRPAHPCRTRRLNDCRGLASFGRYPCSLTRRKRHANLAKVQPRGVPRPFPAVTYPARTGQGVYQRDAVPKPPAPRDGNLAGVSCRHLKQPGRPNVIVRFLL